MDGDFLGCRWTAMGPLSDLDISNEREDMYLVWCHPMSIFSHIHIHLGQLVSISAKQCRAINLEKHIHGPHVFVG